MNQSQPQMADVCIKIRSMSGMFSTMGLHLESNDPLCPKLKPLDVVAVPFDHPIFDHNSSVHIEVTREEPTRPYRFENLHDATAYAATTDDEKQRIRNAIAQVGTSFEQSQRIRAENKARRDEMIANGELPQNPVEPAVDFGALDRAEGLGSVRGDNALARGDDGSAVHPENEGGAQQQVQAPPAGRSRRGRRVNNG